MSADNFLAIVQEPDDSFTAYDCSASVDYEDIEDYRRGYEAFKADDVMEAVQKAQAYSAGGLSPEYGYRFVNLSPSVNKAMRRPKKNKMISAAPKEKKHHFVG